MTVFRLVRFLIVICIFATGCASDAPSQPSTSPVSTTGKSEGSGSQAFATKSDSTAPAQGSGTTQPPAAEK